MTPRVALYSAVGPKLAIYHVDLDGAGLDRLDEIDMPSRVQYAWRHPALPVWYVATASSGPRQQSAFNHVSAWRIQPDGRLRAMGEPRPLPARAVHICVHPSGRYLLSGHNFGGGAMTVHPLAADGSLGAALAQRHPQDFGIYPHQVMCLPSGRRALIVDRGNNPQPGRPEDPGALRSYDFADGQLGPGQVVAPGGGYGFGPRHVDFHPDGSWMYVSDERFNRLHAFRLHGDRIDDAPAFSVPTLARPAAAGPRQLSGPIHVHPRGDAVYVANRADGVAEQDGRPVFAGGENSIAVYEIDPRTGAPNLVQHADIHAFHARTFALDPTAGLLVAASIRPMDVDRGGELERVPAALSVFRVAGRRLEYVRRYAVETPAGELQYWMGMTALP
ncbi:hypothetical protein GCM10023144_22340 [Pigmentiphaga soli]|uniref:3-carboxymuconate cyclase n=1 Tax=Pigmentiphaga soli TaxID=1007095 RepID=A0ABP8GZW4_9BURK